VAIKTGLEGKPWYIGAGIGIVLGAVLFGLGHWRFLQPMKDQLEQGERQLAELQTKLQEGRAAKQQLPKFREEVRQLELELDKLLRILPARRNTPDLLRRIRALAEQGLMTAATDADIQFRVRLQLARHRVRPPGEVRLKRAVFSHPSEEIFANLLDFYRIAWEYEPRSFSIEWDDQERVVEAFTPDFYLPEFDLYVELTTMKQSLVTKKNRKIKRLRELYPEVNVQVFYQKDFENLIFKYGLEKPAEMLR